jgi:cbb3-type cytochrome oxidase subunit 3
MGIVTRLFDKVDGVYWFPIIALLLFVALFVAIVIHTLTIKKSRDRELANMPLDSDNQNEFMNRKH